MFLEMNGTTYTSAARPLPAQQLPAPPRVGPTPISKVDLFIAMSCAKMMAMRPPPNVAVGVPPDSAAVAAASAALRSELKAMHLWDLLARARQSGVQPRLLDGAMEGSRPVDAVVSLVADHETAVPPSPVPNLGCINAAKRGDLGAVREAIREGADLSAVDGNGLTALMQAAATGRLAVVRFLVQTVVSLNDEASAAGSGADRGQQQHCGAGGVSSSEEFAHIVSLTRTASDGYGLRLSRAGIILDVADTKVLEPSPPPTIEVVGGQRFWRVKRAVAGLQIISVEGEAVHGKAEVIAAMRAVKAGESATVTMQKPQTQPPPSSSADLHSKVKTGGLPLLDVMCDAGNGGGCRGGWFSHATALYFAARWGQVPEVAELVRAGANPNLPASLTSTVAGAQELELAAPLHVAAYFGHAAVVALLLQARCGTERDRYLVRCIS